MKKCSKCNQEKTTDCFYKSKITKDGFQARCKTCCKEYSKKHYKENKDYHQDKNKEWSSKNKEYNNQRNKSWMEENKEKRSSYKQKYRKENKDSINEYKRKRLKELMKNPEYRLEVNLRRRLRRTVYKIIGNPLENKSCTQANRDLLGCSINDLQSHIEASFTEGMNWNNYGKWHVDHIKPVCSFDLTNEEQIKECFHYSNLQALWAKDNIKKGGKNFPS